LARLGKVGGIVGDQTGFGERFLGNLAHSIGVLLGVEGPSIVLINEGGTAGTSDGPAYGERVEVRGVTAGIPFALELTKRMHQGDGDVGEDGGAASGNFSTGNDADQAGEKDANVRSGIEVIEATDKICGGILFWLMPGAEAGACGGGVAATAAGGSGVGAMGSHLDLSEGMYPGNFGEECGRGRKKRRSRWYEKRKSAEVVENTGKANWMFGGTVER
jgi:hypothetical protein